MSTASQEQISALLDFLTENSDLARNYVRNQEGRVRSKRLWDQITQELNSLGGAVKTVPQWQKVWADRKYLVKKTRARRNQEARGTGGGPPTFIPESESEKKVMRIMGEGFGGPSTQAVIPPFVDENRSPNLLRPNPQSFVEEIQEEVVTMDQDHLYCVNPLVAVPAAPAPPPPLSVPTVPTSSPRSIIGSHPGQASEVAHGAADVFFIESYRFCAHQLAPLRHPSSCQSL